MAGASMWKDGSRLRIGPLMNVCRVQSMLRNIMQVNISRDFSKLCEGLVDITWKQAPRAKLIHEYWQILEPIIKFSQPGLKLSHDKFRDALMAEHQSDDGAIMFGAASNPLEWQASQISFRLRCLLSKVRSCRDFPTVFENTLQKATAEQTKSLTHLVRISGKQPQLPVQRSLEEHMALADGLAEDDMDLDDILDEILREEQSRNIFHTILWFLHAPSGCTCPCIFAYSGTMYILCLYYVWANSKINTSHVQILFDLNMI